jgi:hypothetical protein
MQQHVFIATLLGYDLNYTHLFIHEENEGKAFSLTSAHVSTYPADGVSWHMVKI